MEQDILEEIIDEKIKENEKIFTKKVLETTKSKKREKMKKQEVPFYYLSARAYAKQTGIGEVEVKKQLLKGELEGFATDNQYKVKVYKDGGISYEQYESVLKRALEAEKKIEIIKSILNKK